MKRFPRWQVIFGAALISMSAALYFLHYFVFRDSHHIFLYLLGDIAFIPIDVLIVTLIIDGILRVREKRTLLNKMNMLIGAFYSEVGGELLRLCSLFDPAVGEIRKDLIVDSEWNSRKFREVKNMLSCYGYAADATKGDLAELKEFLVSKRSFLLGLLANPSLLEHESFTEALWAVFHLTEELAKRKDPVCLPQKDCEHLSIDIKRVYKVVTLEWLAYMDHLRVSYPYLYSLAVRTNPFNPQAQAVIGNT